MASDEIHPFVVLSRSGLDGVKGVDIWTVEIAGDFDMLYESGGRINWSHMIEHDRKGFIMELTSAEYCPFSLLVCFLNRDFPAPIALLFYNKFF